MSSVHGLRGHGGTGRSNSVQRVSVSVPTSIPVSGVVARVRAVTRAGPHNSRAAHHAPPITRQSHRPRAASVAPVTTRRNTAPTLVAHVVPMPNNSVGSGEGRRAQPPVVLGGGPSTRVPVSQSRPTSKPNLRKRPTTGASSAAAAGVSPTKKCRNTQEMLCPVCLDEIDITNPVIDKPIFSTNCGHLFCKPCITSCLDKNNSCPICRKYQTLTDIHPIYMSQNF